MTGAQGPAGLTGAQGAAASPAPQSRINQPLNQRRVATVRDVLIQAGVPADRIETGTFGTDRSMCNPATGQCSPREGRVEVLVRAGN